MQGACPDHTAEMSSLQEEEEEPKPKQPVKLRVKLGRPRKQRNEVSDAEAPNPSLAAVSQYITPHTAGAQALICS